MNTYFLPHRERYASPLQRPTLSLSTLGHTAEGLIIPVLSYFTVEFSKGILLDTGKVKVR
jgi:hypothetical protein